MNRRIRLLPIVLAIGAIAWFYFSSPTFINPETGRKSKVGLSESQEQTLGLQSFQQVLSQSQIIQSGMDYDLVVKVARAVSSESLMRAPEASNGKSRWFRAINKTRFV